MLEFLLEKHNLKAELIEKEKNELHELRRRMTHIKSRVQHESQSNSEEEEEDEFLGDLTQITKRSKGARTSVSAEAYGAWHKKEEFVPKVKAKTEE